ncbi:MULTISPECIES: hypothetical protein [Chelativorans]|jgi:hypothetical protein|uniref:hypothetical protein n=1 Tax=Chelativorans TaxID=449972 RepID=UPI0005A049B0|nr:MULTISPECIES: hypothetical protein [Chelativorans]
MYLSAKRKVADIRRKHIAHGETDELICAVSTGLEALAEALHKNNRKMQTQYDEIVLELKKMRAENSREC